MSYPVESILVSPVERIVKRVVDEYTGAVSITPSDTISVTPGYVRALVVTVAGNVKVTMLDGTIVTIPMLAGVVYKVVVSLVWLNGTSATGIVGLY
jgi:hypothetical protein